MKYKLSKFIYVIQILMIFSFISCQDKTNPVSIMNEAENNGSSKINGSFNSLALVTETLAPFSPSFPSGYASGMIIEGTGMFTQPNFVELNIPVGATIENVFVYWVGKGNGDEGGDEIILVNDIEVKGLLIGTTSPIKGDIIRFSYRGDITGLKLDFTKPIKLDGIQFTGYDARADGAAIVVIYSDENTGTSDVVIHDGADFAWLCAPDDSKPESFYAEEQTFIFPKSDSKRYATLSFMVGDAESIDRPDRIVVKIDGDPLFFNDVLNGSSGEQFDVVEKIFVIPAGVSEITVNVESGPGNCNAEHTPESLVWIFGGLSVYNPPETFGCTYTQGYWKNHPNEWPVEKLDLGDNPYDKEALLKILKSPVKGNGYISLAHQLITTKLNLENGASGLSILTSVNEADQLIGKNWIPPIGDSFKKPKYTSTLIDKLDDYNNGITGPGHCN